MDFNEYYYNMHGHWPPGVKPVHRGQTPISIGRDTPVEFTGSYEFEQPRTLPAEEKPQTIDTDTAAGYHAALEEQRAEPREESSWDEWGWAMDTRTEEQKAADDTAKSFLRELTRQRAEERRQQQDHFFFVAQKGIQKEDGFAERYRQQQEAAKPYRELLGSLFSR